MYLDDIVVCMTAAPVVVDLHMDEIIYYTDMNTAVFKTEANVEFFPQLKSALSDFEVYEGQTLIWQKKGVQAENGVAYVNMSLRGLRKATAYCVKAITYFEDGTVADVKTQNIYIYDRPEYLYADGIFRKNGTEPVIPVIGYFN